MASNVSATSTIDTTASGCNTTRSERNDAKRRSAFDVMMAGQAKQRRLEKAGCRHSIDNVFVELMASARERGAFDDPEQKARSGAWSSDELNNNEDDEEDVIGPVEFDPAIKKQLARIEEEHIKLRKINDEDDGGECSSDDEGSDDAGNGGGSATELPEPLKGPTAGSTLRGINVHRDATSFESKIMGFTFLYSDGAVTSVGKIRGSVEIKMIRLTNKADEYIVEVRPCYEYHRPKYLTNVKFVTNTGRVVEAFKAKRNSFSHYSDDDILKVEEGYALRGVKWDTYDQRIVSLEVGECKKNSAEEVSNTGSDGHVPSLCSLARKAIEHHFAVRSRAIEKSAERDMRESKNDRDWKVSQIFEQGKERLRASAEAEKVRNLRAQLALAEHRLQRRTAAVLANATRRAFDETNDDDECRAGILFELSMGRATIGEDLRSYRDTLEAMNQLGGALDEGGKGAEICTSPACRRFFDWTRVPMRKRCSVPGCPARHPSCGCSVRSCKRCHDSICERHAKEHERICSVVSRSKCGWNKDDGRIQPVMCGRRLKGSDMKVDCFYCGTVCCADCHDRCTGMGEWERRCCNTPWCKQCQERCAGVGEGCCDNCSFHSDLWM